MSFHIQYNKNKGRKLEETRQGLLELKEGLGQILIVMWGWGNLIVTPIHWLIIVGWLVALMISLGQSVGCWKGRVWSSERGRPE